MSRSFEQPERGEGADNRADGVHQAFQAESAAVGVGRDVGGEEGFLRGRADSAAKPCGSAAEKDMVGLRGEGEGGGRKRGEGVPKYGEWFSLLQPVGEMSSRQFCEAGETVGNAFDGAEPGRSRANGREERRQDCRGGFVAPVAEEAGEADAKDGAVEPGGFRRSFGHGAVVYIRQFTVQSLEKSRKLKSPRDSSLRSE